MPRHSSLIRAFRRSPAFMVLVGIMAVGHPPQAGEIFKSLDANGNVVYSDHLDPALGQATLVELQDPRYPPRELHFCWANCFTLSLHDGIYHRVDGTDETWTIETFTAKTVVLHRHVVSTTGGAVASDVVFAGGVANDRLVGVTVNGKATGGIDASWGMALNTLPGSNAERDAGSSALAHPAPVASESSPMPPPPVPPEEQPAVPQEGYVWTPGYWNWRDRGYVWVHGVWVRPPQPGSLWTPAYWAAGGTGYLFHPGYWSSHVGFYGGVNDGHGYSGSGHAGGQWVGTSSRSVGSPSVTTTTTAATPRQTAPPAVIPIATSNAVRPPKNTPVKPARASPPQP